jgi:hypothetical protein
LKLFGRLIGLAALANPSHMLFRAQTNAAIPATSASTINQLPVHFIPFF